MQSQEPEAPSAAPTAVIPTAEETRRARRRQRLKRWGRAILEFPVLVLIAFGIAIIIKTFLVQAFFIPSGSMIPTLRKGDRVLVEKVSYRLHEPRREDVVVFAREVLGVPAPDVPWPDDVRNFLRELAGLPTGREEDYIKRIVAVGGDTIRYAGSPRRLIVNGTEVPNDYINTGKDESSSTITAADCNRLHMERHRDACRVPAGMVFVMGDNRPDSEDSRILGPIEEEKIVGRAFVTIWPFERFTSL